MADSGFFDQIERAAGLPRVVSRASLTRALGRAQLTPASVTANNLHQAMAELCLTIRVYHDEAAIPAYVEALWALCQDQP